MPSPLGAAGVTYEPPLAAEGEGGHASPLPCTAPEVFWTLEGDVAGGAISKIDDEKHIFLLRITIKVTILIKRMIPWLRSRSSGTVSACAGGREELKWLRAGLGSGRSG